MKKFILKTFLLVVALMTGNLFASTASFADPAIDTGSAIVQLKGDPLSAYAKTKPPQGKKIDFNRKEVKSYQSQLSALRNDFKKWLQVNAPKARVTGEYDISLNAVAVELNGTNLSTLTSAPQVMYAEYETVYSPNATQPEIIPDPDLTMINGIYPGSDQAGEGVKIAIIDSGIDQTHPCFSDEGYPAQTQLGDARFTNNKVIVAKVFLQNNASRNYTAEDTYSHGTHVAGTAACNFETPMLPDFPIANGAIIPYQMSGVAPRALLGNYNVFPHFSPTELTSAKSESILNALEEAYKDGFDVANMSLGGLYRGLKDLVTMAVDNLDSAGMIVTVSAGNEGLDGYGSIGSPGSATRALTAGSVSVGHSIFAPINREGQPIEESTSGANGTFPPVTQDLTAPLKLVNVGITNNLTGLNEACNTNLPLPSLSGHIAVISRGSCSFAEKILNTQQAGAVAVLVVNNLPPPDDTTMAGGTASGVTIPAYLIPLPVVTTLVDGSNYTIFKDKLYFRIPANDNQLDPSSSEGPTHVDFRVKPDLVAPGGGVISSVPHQLCDDPACYAMYIGTSMAAPHLAGMAATLRGLHPNWSAVQIRSAIVNTANKTVKKIGGVTDETDVNIIGSGLLNAGSALDASIALDPVSISFGSVTVGTGKGSVKLILTNLGSQPATFNLSIENSTGAGVSYSPFPTSLSLSGGSSGTVSINVSIAKNAIKGDNQAMLIIKKGNTEVAHGAVYILVK
jgi:minor extracellular serine protease Vpr